MKIVRGVNGNVGISAGGDRRDVGWGGDVRGDVTWEWLPQPERLGGGRLIAARVGRPPSVSGWDFVQRGPKPSRRMVPAGAIYWVEFDAPDAAEQWAKDHHFCSISDDLQDRRGGFGLIICGRAS